jgi:cystathionine beta-lyase
MPAVGYVAPEATFFAWMDCRELDLPGGPYEYFLEHAKVGLSDGVPFGEAGKGFARVNFATPRKLLEQILERMADSIEKNE